MPRKLILIKHASPQILPGTPASQWRLSEQGRQRCVPLAHKLSPHDPAILISSREPKAAETAEILAGLLDRPMELADNLHEHLRDHVPHMRSSDFISSVALFFQKPSQRVLGEETADEARDRFTHAMHRAIDRHLAGNLAIVTHGTVIALFVAQHTGQSPFLLWRRLGLPSFVILSLPEFQLLDTLESTD